MSTAQLLAALIRARDYIKWHYSDKTRDDMEIELDAVIDAAKSSAVTRAVCVITGAVLVNEYGWWQACDLFRFGDVWIVNANQHVHASETGGGGDKTLHYHSGVGFFERRNVYVFDDVQLVLSQAALEYMREWPIL